MLAFDVEALVLMFGVESLVLLQTSVKFHTPSPFFLGCKFSSVGNFSRTLVFLPCVFCCVGCLFAFAMPYSKLLMRVVWCYCVWCLGFWV